jgi:preprotein translocase subunit SecE
MSQIIWGNYFASSLPHVTIHAMATKKNPNQGSGIVGFISEVRQELKQVTWPSREQVINLTAVVVGVSVITGAYLGALDYLFVQLTGLIIR